MSTNVVNQSPYLRTTREFPEEIYLLSVETNRSYLDIAQAVNDRTIGIFPTTRPAITGESWILQGGNRRQQTLRQVYTFTTSADIPIGFKFGSINQFSNCHGTFTDGTNYYGAVYAGSTAIAGQLTFFLFADAGSTSTDLIRFVVGAGAPAITQGIIVLEWLSAT